jgi:phage recombination protein Bet
MGEGIATTGNHAVVLNEDIVKKYICPTATNPEIYVFLQLCKAQNLNPFLKEAYLIKYGSSPATIVTGKDTFIKRARSIEQYRGFKAGIIVISNKAVVYREGGMLVKGEELIGGWAEVYRSDLDVPVRAEVAFDEYVGKKKIYKNNEIVGEEINAQWSSKPATMIRKVALVQAHREAFPNQFEGMYSPEEMNVEVDDIEYKADTLAPGAKLDMKAPIEKKAEPTEETQTVNFIPQNVTQKEGDTKGKKWTKYFIKGPDGEYTTFDKNFADMAYTAKESENLIAVTYKATKYGNDIVGVGEATY